MGEPRQAWASRIGFVLAASGSAIGLGNIVFFGANAYKYGGGAFYVPYLIALFMVGIPVMMLEFAIGQRTQRAFPIALRQLVGPAGEFVGWWALLNASIITMYYITLLGWVLGMLFGSFGPLWEPSHATPNFAPESLPNPVGYFFDTLSSPSVVVFVLLIWVANVVICSKGTRTIETAVKFFVPAMWLMMVALVVRGVTLPNGWDGVMYLFKPDFAIMGEFEVWRGAFGQIFFSLSLGFGLLSAYASYLPRDANVQNYAAQTSLLNCSFEYVAGFAIFSMLFAFAIVPKASTLAMSFFVLPQGIAQLPGDVRVYGILFFLLLLFAGLSSSISLVEGVCAATLDKFRLPRWKALLLMFAGGLTGSMLFALPKVIDPGLAGNGTLGLTLLDLFDNRSFNWGLLMVGLAECVLIGWIFGADRFLRTGDLGDDLSGRSEQLGFRGRLWVLLIRYLIPVTLAVLLAVAAWDEFHNGLYGAALVDPEAIGNDGWRWLPRTVPLLWLGYTFIGATLLTLSSSREDA